MPKIQDLRDQRKKDFDALCALTDTAEQRAEKDGGDPRFTAEEKAQSERLKDSLDGLDERIERAESIEQRASWSNQSQGRVSQLTNPDQPGETEERKKRDEEAWEVLTAGRHSLDLRAAEENHQLRRFQPDEVVDLRKRATPDYNHAAECMFRGWDMRAGLQVDIDQKGGFLVPTQMSMQLLQEKDQLNPIRGLSNVIPLSGAVSLGVPTLEQDVGDPDWTAEIREVKEDDSILFGKRNLRPSPLAKFVRISNELIRQLPGSVTQFVTSRLAYKFAVAEEAAFLNGDGTEKPLGMMVNSPDGIPDTRDVIAGDGTDGLAADGTFDQLMTAVSMLKDGYLGNARWLLHRFTLRDVRTLKDSNGQYLWNPGLQAGMFNTILGFPYTLSESMPYAISTGSYVGLFGDFNYYWIVDSYGFTTQILREKFALTNQTAVVGRAQVDGMPVMAEAFVRLKLA